MTSNLRVMSICERKISFDPLNYNGHVGRGARKYASFERREGIRVVKLWRIIWFAMSAVRIPGMYVLDRAPEGIFCMQFQIDILY